MSDILFNLFALPFFYFLSILPFPVLYLFSDLVFVIVYYIFGYRKKVVLQNLRNAFPDKTDDEINIIAKRFYHYLCDVSLETFKMLTISKKGIIEHCKFTPECFDIFKRFADEGKSVILVMGHFGNWEWAGHPFSLLCKQKLYVLYHPLSNKRYEKMMFDMRSRNGTKMIPMRTAFKEMLAHKNELTTTVFVADQTPFPQNAYWTTFLNQDTPIFMGTETIAKKMNRPVVYASVNKVKRGYYEMHAEILTENPSATSEGEISEMHTKRLEKDIIAHPENWLWSHRRWKYKRTDIQ